MRGSVFVILSVVLGVLAYQASSSPIEQLKPEVAEQLKAVLTKGKKGLWKDGRGIHVKDLIGTVEIDGEKFYTTDIDCLCVPLDQCCEGLNLLSKSCKKRIENDDLDDAECPMPGHVCCELHHVLLHRRRHGLKNIQPQFETPPPGFDKSQQTEIPSEIGKGQAQQHLPDAVPKTDIQQHGGQEQMGNLQPVAEDKQMTMTKDMPKNLPENPDLSVKQEQGEQASQQSPDYKDKAKETTDVSIGTAALTE